MLAASLSTPRLADALGNLVGNTFDWVSASRHLLLFLLTGTLAVMWSYVQQNQRANPVVAYNTAGLMIVASLAVGVAMFGPAVFLTQYFQLGKGHSATAAV